MPWIIDYPTALERLVSHQFKSNYHNSGAFGFAQPGVKTIAFTGPDDPTIRPAARPFLRPVRPPYEPTLTALLTRAWTMLLPGSVWVMPMSHWAYELNFGSREWLPAVLEGVQVDPGQLENLNNAAPIEFAADETARFEHLCQRLLEMLMGSDFAIWFVDRPVLCTLHHHKQLWWQTTDPLVAAGLEELVRGFLLPAPTPS